ncbi:MAG: hypothetical protein M1825_004839 [Sarcosagium campestre]|nr:MAG: hypothetical protein M1825_004839 [Sarcosagium campestre]
MNILSLLWRLSNLVLIVITNIATVSTSEKGINVALQASFDRAPFLLELLETAADENGTSYFPLLDRIADGYFSNDSTDEELYSQFLDLLKHEGHISRPEVLASFQFALSLHDAAPRIQAHYQFYETAIVPSLRDPQPDECTAWVQHEGQQYCSPLLEEVHGKVNRRSSRTRQFDRVLGANLATSDLILYADITDARFGLFHKILSQNAREGKTTYRVRYRPHGQNYSQPMTMNGYGAELALKRTDYIVIDDRDAADKKALEETRTVAESVLGEITASDIKPLSSPDLAQLSLKTSDFILEHKDPFMALLQVTQDFPKYSAIIASRAISGKSRGPKASRNNLAPQGYNGVWINGLQLLQRTYPGQLPTVRRDIHILVLPCDLTKADDLDLIVSQLQTFVKRLIPVRFGLVPLMTTQLAFEQAQLLYYLSESYGLSAALAYLELITEWDQSLRHQKHSGPSKPIFESVRTEYILRKDAVDLPWEEIFEADHLRKKVEAAGAYARRLGLKIGVPPIFVNGIALPRSEEWLSAMSTRVTLDLRTLQRAVFEETVQLNDWIPNYYLSKAAFKRNPLIIPEDESDIKILDLESILAENANLLMKLPHLAPENENMRQRWSHVILVADFSSENGIALLSEAITLLKQSGGLEIMLLHNPNEGRPLSMEFLDRLKEDSKIVNQYVLTLQDEHHPFQDSKHATNRLVLSLGLRSGELGIVVGGRLCGPFDASVKFSKEDLQQLIGYEDSRRLKPVFQAMTALGLSEKIDQPLTLARLSAAVAISLLPEAAEGIFEATPPVRTNEINDWSTNNTLIDAGDSETPIFVIIASIDPASELAQRWIPILKVLSELEGVRLKLFLNPQDEIKELPIKRFYRYIAESKPSFDSSGKLLSPSARFDGIPGEMLLTMGMDVPPSWLVAPLESSQDLDNIRLSALKNPHVEAIYELEHILIEGHSRDTTTGQPPRGAQLVLGTDHDYHTADTIVMANLGYFQFKANPGLWKIDLKVGRSQEVFSIDSAGIKGYDARAGDESTEIELTSFQGKTLFPRLSRKLGQNSEDVLEETNHGARSIKGYLSNGIEIAKGLFSFAGISKTEKHADINIFSVASGHMYERMLNIMMVSVMNHTSHTVKFWFIEQFLSPSFKDFLPDLAAEYGFAYELVTYKWPHWLRAQKEKQREIWGYKILFLDVLFPLSLNKVIFVDADQIVRADMYDLIQHDLEGAPYGFTPMCDSRTEMEGFRFWKQGYWKNFLRGLPYHISALYVVDLRKFRQIAAGDRLRQQYHQLSADPNSLSNLDQDLPNHMQHTLPMHSLPQEWLWCETWCSDDALREAKTIDLCNNPMTKEPKLDRARRQVPEWTIYDKAIETLRARRVNKEKEEPAVTSTDRVTKLVPTKDEL